MAEGEKKKSHASKEDKQMNKKVEDIVDPVDDTEQVIDKNQILEEGEVEDAVVKDDEEDAITKAKEKKFGFDSEKWSPKTEIGKRVKTKDIVSIDYIFDNGYKILEEEVVDILLPDMTSDLLFVGQAKGKFGGGKKRIFRQTQKKTREGNKPSFSTLAVIGNEDGYVGLGFGKAKETVPAREKAIRKAKLNIMKIRRGCGSWQCNCKTSHSVPFAITGKSSSAEITLMPAPKGTGLVVEKECAKILKAAGIKDVWSKTKGQTGTKMNLLYACMDALKNMNETKCSDNHKKVLSIIDGADETKKAKNVQEEA